MKWPTTWLKSAAVAGVVIWTPTDALARQPGTVFAETTACPAIVSDPEDRRPPPVAPLWIANGSEGDLTLERLAQLGAPILWFSPREFLLPALVGQRRLPSFPGPLSTDSTPTVFYRIREVRLKTPVSGPARIAADGDLGATLTDRLRKVDEKWGCSGDALPLAELDHVIVRYFFYYRQDRGIGGHAHDWEAFELRLQMKPACEANGCFHSLQIKTAVGSAHGVGWYTNVLHVEHTDDTAVPITVLVEENKHASSPDRDGDGLYMPHYDVNRFSNDAWGIRDVAGTGKLGSPAYSAEQSRVLRAIHPEQRAIPNQQYWSPRLYENFRRLESAAGRPLGAKTWTYTLQPGPAHDLCSAGVVAENRIKTLLAASDARLVDPISKAKDQVRDAKRFVELATKLTLCAPTSTTRIYQASFARRQRIYDFAAVFFPGPRSWYGFMSWPQRLSGAWRLDGGRQGASYIGPMLPGFEMPVFGGWFVSKVNVSFDSLKDLNLGAWSLDGVYMPSASGSATWYAAVGHEWRSFDRADRRSGQARVDRSHGVAEEFGVKFRFSLETFKIVKFYGARIGVRAFGLNPIRDPRLVVEIGAGSW